MSIYRKRNLFELEGKHWSPAPAKSVAAEADQRDWSKDRKASPADYLMPKSKAWIQRLPPELVPAALAAQYPRIANLIATAWDDREGARVLFEDLLEARRKNRRGFPEAVERDLWNLRDYWYTGLLPKK